MANEQFHRFIVVYRLIFISIFVAVCFFLIGGTRNTDNAVTQLAEPTSAHFKGENNTKYAHFSIEHQYLFDPGLISDNVFKETQSEAKFADTDYSVTSAEKATEKNGSGNVVYLGKFRCTAYCPCYECSEGYGRGTATGAIARADHTVAVDPRVIPYGTYLMINGITYRAEDCGGGVNGNSIDIFFDTHWETEQFGLRYLDVYRVY